MEEVRYCEKCGAYIPQGEEKCIACGGGGKPEDGGAKDHYARDNDLMVFVDGNLTDIIHKQDDVLDLDALTKGEVKCKMFGKVGRAYIADRRIIPCVAAGRRIDGTFGRKMFDCATATIVWTGVSE